MKKVVFTFLLCFMASHGSAQHTLFRKIIENKYWTRYAQVDTMTRKTEIVGTDNLNSKGTMERLLFGKINGNTEFFVDPSPEAAYGFQIVKNPADTTKFLLEVKHIVNWKEANDEADKKYPTVGIPMQLMASLPKDIVHLTTDHNIAMYPLQKAEVLKLYKAGTDSVPISDRFAERLHARFVSLIDHFKGGELMQGLVGGGETVTFRVIVDQELWTLAIPLKTEGEALELSDLCKQMIADVEAGTFDEAKYIRLLED